MSYSTEFGAQPARAEALTTGHWSALRLVTEGRVRFWLSIPFTMPSGFYVDGNRASADERAVLEALANAGLIRTDTQTLPYNYVVLTEAGADLLR